MLLNLREYHRISPHESRRAALDQVLALLERKNIHTVPLAGGSSLIGSADPSVEAVVDLHGLGLDGIRLEEGVLTIGAMVTRAALAQDENAARIYDGLLGRAARLWGGSVQRNRATVGGAIALAAPDDPLVAALLVSDAMVVLYAGAPDGEVPLSDFLPRRAALLAVPALIVEVRVPVPPKTAAATMAVTARTPADSPIVLAVAALQVRGALHNQVRLALGGVAPTVVRVAEVEAMLASKPISAELIGSAAARAGDLVDPVRDFRGSAEYRRAMARVLSERALLEAWSALSG
jgi:carbon-monoxide dehydrogenase medium subunit